ncbi:MAG: hypothetical protein ACRCTA_05080 [Bacilli bacterium]
MNKGKGRIRLLSIFLTGFFIFIIVQDVIAMYQIQSNIKAEKAINTKLKEESEYLNREVLKFNDEEYTKAYTMGVTYMTKNQLKIYMLPTPEKTPED